jgi:hypothetical protein
VRRRTWTAVAAALAGVIAVGASGCGSSASIDPVAKAATVSTQSSGYRMAIAMVLGSSALPAPITASGSGSFTPTRRTGSLNLVMHLGSVPGVTQALGGPDLNLQEVLNGSTFYIRVPPALARKLPGGKPWLEVNLQQLAGATGMPGLGTLLSNPTTGNPAQMLQYLRATSGSVTKVGSATIGGVQTTEYRATIDLDKYPNLLPPDKRGAARQAITQLESQTHLKTFPAQVWIDKQHLVRQMQLAFTEQLPSGAQQLHLQMTLRFLQYGPQPAPVLPATSQVTNLAALLGRSG